MSRTFLTLLLLACSACTALATRNADPTASAPEIQVALDPSLHELGPGPEDAWRFYGALKSVTLQRKEGRSDDYSLEVLGRKGLAKYWQDEVKPKRGESNAYLDTLVEIERAGQLEEYVLVALARPGWTIPGGMVDELDLQGFATWSRENLGGHQVETLAGVRRGDSDLSPAIPGDDLPSMEELAQGDGLCASLPRASAAYATWRQLEAKAPGLALGSRSRSEFLAALALAQASGAARGRAVTWVSPKAADLSFLVGFCETERNQPAASVEPLETAVRLQPLTPMWHLELVMGLTAVKRFEDAKREIQAAIALTDDDCVLGAAWRKQGFLEIETGELEQAELSYKKSLEYEPGNEIARSELNLIFKQRMNRGDAVSEPYTPPPALGPVKKVCPGG